jgi:UDP-N-acetylglucosamine 2-epimerase (non-hydrolysing)
LKKLLKVILVAGARPNFVKIAPIMEAMHLFRKEIAPRLVHTGQHYDDSMSAAFFQDLEIPEPEINLGCGSGSHAYQTAKIMIEFEKEILENPPDLVMVVGDVNSTLACSLVAKKMLFPVAHVEAGLRSRDMTMPEEINRKLTDAIADILFTTSHDADENLIKEGISRDRIFFVGNVMIDSLLKFLPSAKNRNTMKKYNLEENNYACLTLHRPTNVDELETFSGILEVLLETVERIPIIWPIHPRAKKKLVEFGFYSQINRSPGLIITDPLPYIDMLSLNLHSKMIITDSGGLQEEAVILRKPCITLRDNTERPVTVDCGSNVVVGNRPEKIALAIDNILRNGAGEIRTPELWDGCASERIVKVLLNLSLQGIKL